MSPWRKTSRVFETLDHDQAPILAITLSNDTFGVMFVYELGRGIAIFLQHSTKGVVHFAKVETRFVGLRSTSAFQLDASDDGGRELAGTPAVTFCLWTVRIRIRKEIMRI